MDMKIIMYTSVATEQPRGLGMPSGLSSVVIECRKNNPVYDISGALYHRLGRYLQIIEGESTNIDRLMTNILTDPRHEQCQIQLETTIKNRVFPKWQCQLSMAINRDLYFKKFLTQYSSDLKAMSAKSRVAWNHFFKKEISKSNQEASYTPLDVFGNEMICLRRMPESSTVVSTPTMTILCRLLEQKPHTHCQLVSECGEEKRDEILFLLTKLNNQGLLEFKDNFS